MSGPESPMRQVLNSLLARLLMGWAVPLVLFGTVGLVAAVVISRLLSTLALEKHTHEVIIQALYGQNQLERIRDAVLAGGDRRKVAESAAYQGARQEFAFLFRRLRNQVRDNEEQRARVDGLQGLLARLDEALAAGDGDAAERLLAQMNVEVRTFIRTEEGSLEDRRARTEGQTRQSVVVVGVAVGLALLLTVLLSLRLARSVTQPVRRLREAAGQLLAGRLGTVPPFGPTEVVELIVHFNHMAVTLAERASLLQRQEERYRVYIGSVAHILWTTNADGAVTADLPTWRAYTGQGEEQTRGAGWFDAIHPEDRPAVEHGWRDAVARGAPFETECRLRSALGEYHHFSWRGVPIVTADGAVREWVGTCTDITEIKQKAALREAKEEAEAASRAKSEFLAKMSHELRTPLNAVIGMSKMLSTQRFGTLNAKQADYLNDITQSGEHLLALINDILDLSKVEAGRMEVAPDPFAVEATLQATVSPLARLAEAKGVRLQLAPGADGVLHTDPARFRQVLYNLLSNAIKYTPSPGAVTVRREWVDGAARGAAGVPEGEATALRVTVQDTGIGIAPEDQEAVWDEFRQLKPGNTGSLQGTGLGLALTRRLVRLLGGSIWLESAVGRGSTFTFALPRVLPSPGGAAAEAAPAPAAGQRALALVVEDYAPTHKLLTDWLDEAGLATASAYDGEEGLAEARRLRPQLIVLDLNLPKMDGWQLLTALKSDPATAAIPVVVVTISEDRQPTAGLGVQEFFVKPVDRDAFLRRLRQLQPALFRPDRPLHALVAEDDPGTRKLLVDMLQAEGVVVSTAADGREALAQLEAATPDVVLLDLMMPGADGFTVVETLRGKPELAGLPVLIVTAKDLTAEDRRRLQGHVQALWMKQRLTPERLRQQLEALGLVTPEKNSS